MKAAVQNTTPPPVRVDAASRTIRPETAAGDEFFGLAPGTNGSSSISRRAVLEAAVQTASGPFTWVRSNGSHASGINLIPSNRGDKVNTNPWSGMP